MIRRSNMSLKVRRLNQETGGPMPGEGHKEVNTVMAVDKTKLTAYSCRVLRIGSGGSTAMHDHGRTHVVMALSGKARVETGEEVAEITPGIVVTIPAGVPHRFVNMTDKKTALLVQNLYTEDE